ncbi:unnamed protein product [Amoebophrya sp. A25]|nr:unnamed protein product [Amoebophrya sp. A25]|eukprot:GSA25T00005571001.1
MSLGRWLRKTLPGIYTKSKSIADRCRVFVDAELTTLKKRRRGNDFGSGYSGILSSDRCIDNLLKFVEEEGNFSGTTGKSSSLLYGMNRQEMPDSDAQEHQKGAGRWCGHRLPKLFTTTHNYSQRWCGKHIIVHVVIPALLSQVGDVQSRDNGKPSMFDAVGEQYPDGSPETDTIEGEDFAEVPNSLISVAPSGKVSSFTEREAAETPFPADGLFNLRRDVVADLRDIIVVAHQQQDEVVNGVVAKLEEVFSDKVSSENLQQIRASHQEQMKELRQDVKEFLQLQQTVISQKIRELCQKVEKVFERVEQHQQQQKAQPAASAGEQKGAAAGGTTGGRNQPDVISDRTGETKKSAAPRLRPLGSTMEEFLERSTDEQAWQIAQLREDLSEPAEAD